MSEVIEFLQTQAAHCRLSRIYLVAGDGLAGGHFINRHRSAILVGVSVIECQCTRLISNANNSAQRGGRKLPICNGHGRQRTVGSRLGHCVPACSTSAASGAGAARSSVGTTFSRASGGAGFPGRAVGSSIARCAVRTRRAGSTGCSSTASGTCGTVRAVCAILRCNVQFRHNLPPRFILRQNDGIIRADRELCHGHLIRAIINELCDRINSNTGSRLDIALLRNGVPPILLRQEGDNSVI